MWQQPSPPPCSQAGASIGPVRAPWQDPAKAQKYYSDAQKLAEIAAEEANALGGGEGGEGSEQARRCPPSPLALTT